MTRYDWWLGIVILCAALVFHAVFPRYEVHARIAEAGPPFRVDRWTGAVGRAPVLPTGTERPSELPEELRPN